MGHGAKFIIDSFAKIFFIAFFFQETAKVQKMVANTNQFVSSSKRRKKIKPKKMQKLLDKRVIIL